MAEHKREHDNDPVGILIGVYRIAAVAAVTLITSIAAYYWDDMKQSIDKAIDSFHVLAVNVAGINEKLSNIDKVTEQLKTNQNDIVILVSKNSDNINDNTREIDKLKLRVNYLEK